jgi:hypothetical protein
MGLLLLVLLLDWLDRHNTQLWGALCFGRKPADNAMTKHAQTWTACALSTMPFALQRQSRKICLL